MKLFDNMVFVSPEENYDAFCDMNIANDKRRSMSLFLTNLYKNNVITMDIVFANIVNIQNILMTNKNDISKKKENEELSENLYTLLTNIPFFILSIIFLFIPMLVATTGIDIAIYCKAFNPLLPSTH